MAKITFQDLQKRVGWHIAGTKTITNLDSDMQAEIKDGLNDAMFDIFKTMRISAFKREFEIVMSEGKEEYILPNGMLSIIDKTMYIDGDELQRIGLVSEQDWVQTGGYSMTNGKPIGYTDMVYDVNNNSYSIKLRPVPGSNETGVAIKGQGYFEPTTMSADGDIPPIPHVFHSDLVHGAIVSKFLQFLDGSTTQQWHMGQWQKALRNMRRLAVDPVVGRRAQLKMTQAATERTSSIFSNDFTI